MAQTRFYTVTYISADGEQLTETMEAHNHVAVEQIIKSLGGTVVDIEREEHYPRLARSPKRTVGCMVIVLVLVALVIALYCYRMMR